MIINKESVVKYSVLKDNKQLFMSKYQLYLPSKEKLQEEINKSIDNLMIKDTSYKYNEESIYQTIVKALNEIITYRRKNPALDLVVIELGPESFK